MSLSKFDFAHKDIYLLLGPQEVGKTCFLSGLYYAFRSSLNGFSLSCLNEEQRMELDGICRTLGNGNFPNGTSSSAKYEFTLRYAYEGRFNFEWFDYRGGLLGEYGLRDQAEYDEMIGVINNSTCILICVDGTWLSKDKDESVKKIQDKSYVINNLIDCYIDSNNKLPPICIVITKYDMCDPRYDDIYFDAIKDSFPFFDNENTPVFICPVCIGSKDNESGRFNFAPTDKDVYRPLFYALWCGYSYRIEGVKRNLDEKGKAVLSLIEELEKERNRLEEKIIAIRKNKRIEEKNKDISKLHKILEGEEKKIAELESERVELFKNISAAKEIYLGTKKVNWNEVEEKWKFFQ